MIVEHRSVVPASAEAVFAWYGRPGAVERLLPPWESVRLAEPDAGLVEGGRLALRVRAGFGSERWGLRRVAVEPGRGFVDEQVQGPFAHWRHEHRFEPRGPGESELVDRIDFALRGGPLGELAEPWARRRIVRALYYRHRVTCDDLALWARCPGIGRLRVAVTGGSGLIGTALRRVLLAGGHEVVPMVRRAPGPGEIEWNPSAGRLDPDALSGCDAVVHLAGENIAAARWTARRKARIRSSRIDGTTLLAEALARASRPPRVLVSGSAIGIYGDRGDSELDEQSSPGTGFLPEVVRAWEAATEVAAVAGIRTVLARTAPVLTPSGGLLARVAVPFSLGAGGPLGSGRQWMSWIGIDDAVGGLVHALATERVVGPMNLASPGPVRNAEFAAALGRVLRRPSVLPVPAFALRLALGDLADEALLASARVRPAALLDSGYVFRHSDLESALRHLLGRGA